MSIITLKDYWMGRDESHTSELTTEIFNNAEDLIGRVNQLLVKLVVDTDVNSGWRPHDVNRSIGGAPNSYHISGKAIDLKDTHGEVAYKIIQHHQYLDMLGLWLEWPQATKGWVHLDTGERTARRVRTFRP